MPAWTPKVLGQALPYNLKPKKNGRREEHL